MKTFLLCYFFVSLLLLGYCEWKFKLEDYAILKSSKHFILSTKIDKHKNSIVLREQLKDGVYFNIYLNNRELCEIFIKVKSEKLMNEKTEFFIFDHNTSRIVPKYSSGLLEGFITKEKYASYVLGYIEEVCFYGKISTSNKTYYIEKLKRYVDIFPEYSNSSKNAIIFERLYIANNSENSTGRNPHSQVVSDDARNVFRRLTKNGNMCSLLVILDYSFLNVVHQMNIDYATHQVLMSIDEANSLFRSTDFDEDGYPDNIGFYIKYFIVLHTPDNNHLIPKFSKKPVDGRLFMRTFSRYHLMEKVCLGAAFTGQSFKENIIGISYSAVPTSNSNSIASGGICDRPFLNPFGLNLNTLAVSARSRNGRNVPQFIFDLSLCHELGHSFGADHDVTTNCIGYLMTAQTPLDQNRKHFVFSSCSKRDMLKTIIRRGQCFEIDRSTYCGNRIKEITETCDCGTIRDCLVFDDCCTPHGRPNACKIKKENGYSCHPSQGACCTSLCKYANLEDLGLDCRNFNEMCPCRGNRTTCRCGINGRCKKNTCSSEECTRVGLEECACPSTLNITGCRTCCLSKNIPSLPCSLANVITKFAIDFNESLFHNLRSVDSKLHSVKYGFYETYCAKGDCTKLYFRKVKVKEFCTIFGRLGDCKNNNQCVQQEKSVKFTEHIGKIWRKSSGTVHSNNRLWVTLIIKNILFNIPLIHYYLY